MKKIMSLLFVLVLSSHSFGDEEIYEIPYDSVPPQFSEDDSRWWSSQERQIGSDTQFLVYGDHDIRLSKAIDSHLNYCSYYQLTTLACAQSLQHYVNVKYLRIHDEQIGLLHERLEALETVVPDTGTYELLDAHDTFIGWWTFGDDNTASIALSDIDKTLLYRYTSVIPLEGTPDNVSQYITYDCSGFEFARFTDTLIDPIDYIWVNGEDVGVVTYISDEDQQSEALERPMYQLVSTDGQCGHDGYYDDIQGALHNRAYEMRYSTVNMEHPKPWRLGEARSD